MFIGTHFIMTMTCLGSPFKKPCLMKTKFKFKKGYNWLQRLSCRLHQRGGQGRLLRMASGPQITSPIAFAALHFIRIASKQGRARGEGVQQSITPLRKFRGGVLPLNFCNMKLEDSFDDLKYISRVST